MRITINIDDDVHDELTRRAQQEKTSLSKMVNLVLRKGVIESESELQRTTRYREKTYSMGLPLVDLTKALSLSVQIEDEEILKKMARGK